MKRLLLLPAIAGLTLMASCTKEAEPAEITAELRIDINEGRLTKSTEITTEEEDKTVNSVDVFVFKESGSLDVYGHFTSSAGISLNATVGTRSVAVVVNAHDFNISGITTMTALENAVSCLVAEDLRDFTMFGVNSSVPVASNGGSATVSVSRLVSRVTLANLTVDFSDTPLAGKTITDVSTYIKNVPSAKTMDNRDCSETSYISGLSYAGTVEMTGLLKDGIGNVADGASHGTDHNFFSYERSSVSDMSGAGCVRLVIRGSIDGEVYYWSVPVNTVKGGYKAANGHYGVKANHTYAYNVTIKNKGVPGEGYDDPQDPDADGPFPDDQDLEYGNLTVSLNIAPWTHINVENVEF